jgi:FkbM family methyltransferase
MRECDIFFWDYQPKSNDIVLDVGAGFGEQFFALRTRVGPGGRVFGFEAHPATFAKLTLLCELNGWSNVEIVQAAVIDRSRPVFISDNDDYQTNNVFSPGAHEVEGIALDDFVVQRGISHVDYIKMNIEGAERLAILGMDELAKITDHICISCHDFLGTEWGTTSEQVRAWLESKGFRVLNRPNDGSPWVPFYMYASKTNGSPRV